MGMKQAEIARRFDDIVAFSGVERFIDTQLKRYSSGMNARLGFAVAAHLEPEVLIIDEVLSVGDSMFQARCLDRIMTLKQAGVTLVFVSHNLPAVEESARSRPVAAEGRGEVPRCAAERDQSLPREHGTATDSHRRRLSCGSPGWNQVRAHRIPRRKRRSDVTHRQRHRRESEVLRRWPRARAGRDHRLFADHGG